MKKEYFSEIKNQKLFLEENDDGIYYLGNKLSLMGEEQENKSKTGSNYYYKRESDGTEFYFKIKGNKCDLTETVSKNEHTVWLEYQRSLTFYNKDEHIVLRNESENANEKNKFNVIDKQEANNILSAVNNDLLKTNTKKFFDPIKNQDTYLREFNGEIYLGLQKLSLMGDEQKNKSKTGSNYYYKRERDGAEFYFKIEGDKCSLTETIFENEKGTSHTVWLKENKSLTFNSAISDVVYSDNDKIKSPSTLISKNSAKEIIEKNDFKNNEVLTKPEVQEVQQEKSKNLIISSIKSIRDKLFGNTNTNTNQNKLNK